MVKMQWTKWLTHVRCRTSKSDNKRKTLFLVFFCHFSGLFIVSFKCFSARYTTSVYEARPHPGVRPRTLHGEKGGSWAERSERDAPCILSHPPEDVQLSQQMFQPSFVLHPSLRILSSIFFPLLEKQIKLISSGINLPQPEAMSLHWQPLLSWISSLSASVDNMKLLQPPIFIRNGPTIRGWGECSSQ